MVQPKTEHNDFCLYTTLGGAQDEVFNLCNSTNICTILFFVTSYSFHQNANEPGSDVTLVEGYDVIYAQGLKN